MTVALIVIAVISVAVVGGLAVLVLRSIARASILVHLAVLSVATVLCVVAPITALTVATGSSSETKVVSGAIIGAIGSLIVSLVLGIWIVRNSSSLGRFVRTLGTGGASADQATLPEGNAETTALAGELLVLQARLEQAEHASGQMEQSRRELLTLLARDLRVPLDELRTAREGHDPERVDAALRHLDAMIVDLVELSQPTPGLRASQRETES